MFTVQETFSLRNGEEILRDRLLYNHCIHIAQQYDVESTRETRRTLIESGQFVANKKLPVGGNMPCLHGYDEKSRIGIRIFTRTQWEVRSHLLFSEMWHLKGLLDVSVLVLPTKGQAEFIRTKREVFEFEIFTEYFPLTVPLFLIGRAKE